MSRYQMAGLSAPSVDPLVSSKLTDQAPPPAEVFEFDMSETPDTPDINESNLRYSGDQAVVSADAEAYFVRHRKSQLCYTLTGVIACQFSGPVKVLLVYRDEEKFFDLGAGENGVCYHGE